MDQHDRAKAIRLGIIITAFALILGLGIMVRLADPLSSTGVPAEDPYTHMILVRGHVADGDLDPVYPGGTLYPPGLHAFLAATWAYTGLDLYDIFRVGPVVFGAIGIIGVALLVGRHVGPLAALIASLAVALAPEIIFRTTMMAPTAMDLAILPFVFLVLLEALRTSRWWLIPSAVLIGFLVVAHPWVVAILGPVIVGWMLVALLAPAWGGGRSDPVSIAVILGLVGLATAGAANICWDENCGLTFDQLVLSDSAALDMVAWIIAGVAIGLGALLFLFRRAAVRLQEALERRSMPLAARLLSIIPVAALLAALTLPAVRAGMPEYVDLPRMLGWPVLGLAALAIVATFAVRSPLMLPMAALVAVTYPFVIFNPFESEFWPHRTVAYLGIGLVALAGVGGALIIDGLRVAAERLGHYLRPRAARTVSMGAAATVLGTLVMAGTVYAATPLEYEEGWYRLYPDCEFEALRDIAEEAGPDTVVVAGDWQAKLVMGAFADGADNIWYNWEMFAYEDRRGGTLQGMALEGRDVIMVEDRYLRTERGHIDTSFLEEEPWEPLGQWCAEGVPEPRLSAYIVRAVPE